MSPITHLYYHESDEGWERIPVHHETAKFIFVREYPCSHPDDSLVRLDKATLLAEGHQYSNKSYLLYHLKPVMHDGDVWHHDDAEGWVFDSEATKASRDAEQAARERDPLYLMEQIVATEDRMTWIRSPTGMAATQAEHARLMALLASADWTSK